MLRHGIERYAEHIRETAARARREMAAADRNAQEAVERGRSELRHREEGLKRAQAALTQGLHGPQQDCSGLRQQVQAAGQRHAEAMQRLDRARQAARITAEAQSDLIKAMQVVEATVSEHGSLAASALASLDAKIAELPRPGAGHALSSARLAAGPAPKPSYWLLNKTAEMAVAIKIMALVMNFVPVAGDAARAAGFNQPVRDHSITGMEKRQTQQQIDFVGEQAAEEAERARFRSWYRDRP